jgi:acetyl-CoA C-acetyltransferase
MGYRMGDIPTGGSAALYDAMLHDALYDSLVPGHMGVTADNVAKLCGVTRQECDELAVISHNRACAAVDGGKFVKEIAPFVIQKKKGDLIIDTDEHPIRNCTYETLSKMKPVFTPDGVTTAANASGINDGAAAAVIMSADKAKELGLKPMAKLLYSCSAGVEPKYMGIGPAFSNMKALKHIGLTVGDMDVWECNEAFAAQNLAVIKEIETQSGKTIDQAKWNPNGGAIAIGHPNAASGARITYFAMKQLEKIGGKYASISSCCGGGQGSTAIIENLRR